MKRDRLIEGLLALKPFTLFYCDNSDILKTEARAVDTESEAFYPPFLGLPAILHLQMLLLGESMQCAAAVGRTVSCSNFLFCKRQVISICQIPGSPVECINQEQTDGRSVR